MDLKDVRAVIMVGGKGTRLRPYTVSLPKPLVPIGDLPILEILLRQLHKAGFKDVTLTLGYLSELVQAYLSQSKSKIKDFNFSYVFEDKPTGTAGSLGNIKDITDTFIVMNGDVLTDIDHNKLISYHKEQKADITIASYQKKVKIDLGVLNVNDEGLLQGYDEKPTKHYAVSMGINVLEPTAFEYITPGEYLDMPTLILNMLADGRKIAVYNHDGEWLDIGNPDDYAKAQDIFAEGRTKYNVD